MLRYYYIEQKKRLYVHDDESGFFRIFNERTEKWEISALSFSRVERDNDIDFVNIPEADAKQISKGVGFDEELRAFLAAIGNV